METNLIPTSHKITFAPSFLWGAKKSGLPWLVLGVLLLLSNLGYQGSLLWQIQEEQRIWEEGHDAGQAAVRGQKYTRYSFFYEYDFEVIYNDAALHVYHRPLKFSTLKSDIDDELEPMVKYDINNPTQFAVSWGTSQKNERYLAIALFGSFWSLVGLLLCWMGYQKLAPLRQAKRCLKAPAWAAFRVVEQKKNKKTTTLVYEFGKKTSEVFFDEGELGPFLLEDGKKLLALCEQNNPSCHILIRSDLYPVLMNEEEKKSIGEIF